MKKILIAIAITFVIIAVVVLITGRVFFPDNSAETATGGGRKNLKTRIYKTDPETAEKIIMETIPELSTYGRSWKIVSESESPEKGKIIKAEVPVVIFTDDLEIYIKKSEDRISIDAKSSSRVGKSDFGENARHIRQLLNALDEKFQK